MISLTTTTQVFSSSFWELHPSYIYFSHITREKNKITLFWLSLSVGESSVPSFHQQYCNKLRPPSVDYDMPPAEHSCLVSLKLDDGRMWAIMKFCVCYIPSLLFKSWVLSLLRLENVLYCLLLQHQRCGNFPTFLLCIYDTQHTGRCSYFLKESKTPKTQTWMKKVKVLPLPLPRSSIIQQHNNLSF